MWSMAIMFLSYLFDAIVEIHAMDEVLKIFNDFLIKPYLIHNLYLIFGIRSGYIYHIKLKSSV